MRFRAAPAPSGELHVGNVRTFLFNWLCARHVGGVFILRIEDTDRARFTEEAYLSALEDLRWIGLDWDEGPEIGGTFGPYRQSERAEMHRNAGMRLLEMGAAYRCFCTAVELDERRKQAMSEGRKPGYDSRCDQLTESQIAANMQNDLQWTVRFRVPKQGSLTFDDLVVGSVTVDHSQIDDFVILRSDGSPLYQLGVVVDDAEMQITHVVRGDDHLSNVPKQILLHQALGAEPPIFAHVPQVFGPDRKPLSKRHGSTSIGEFRNGGYLPEALFNYLVLLGWGTAADTILTRADLVRLFDIEHVHASPAMFDFKKLDWMNGEYIRMLDDEEISRGIEPWLARAKLVGVPATEEQREMISKIAPLIRSRIKKLDESVHYARPFFEEVAIEQVAFEKVMREPHVLELLDRATEELAAAEIWDASHIEEVLRAIQTAMDLKPKTAFMPFYVAVEGSTVGAPVFDAMAILGKQTTLDRIAIARSLLV